jgi:hypothetical protein
MLMAALALAGITGVYLRQVTKIGVLGLLGYVLFAAGYLSMLGTEYVAALVLPSIAHSATAYVNDVIAVANNRPATGDIGLMHPAILFTGITYIAGGFVFAIALFRANVLARWAAALLALGTLATIAVGLVPQYERLFALPTGLALVGLGYSLWREQRAPAAPPILNPARFWFTQPVTSGHMRERKGCAAIVPHSTADAASGLRRARCLLVLNVYAGEREVRPPGAPTIHASGSVLRQASGRRATVSPMITESGE